MPEPHCQPIEVDGKPVIACGPRITDSDREAIREFSEYLTDNPRTTPENGDTNA